MKKKNNVLLFTLLVCTVMAVFTCKQNIGLGARVNILPPSGQITYPDAGETPIRGSFVMRGTASDDNGVQSVSIVFENIETNEKTKAFQAVLSDSGTTSVIWTANIDNESTGSEPGHELVKVYPIPDGEYTAIVTVTDKGGKTSTFTKNYKIDNTPPVFIVSRPSTTVDATDMTTSQADGYGAIFSVVGQAGERNTVEKLNVHVPGATPIDMTNMFVGNNINAQVAVHSAVLPLNPLYDLQEQDKTKPIRGQLYLYDNAREYKGGDASGEGNKADWYYLRDKIYKGVMEKGYTAEVISDYFAGKKGSDKNDHDKKIKELRSDTAALAKLKSEIVKMSEKRSSFKLDPSKSPGFKVIGVKHLSGPMTSGIVSQSSSMLFKAGSDTKFSVELMPNKDNIPLVEGSEFADYKASKIKILLLKWNGSDFDSSNPISLIDFETLTETYFNAHPDMIKKEGGNLRIQCTFPSDKGEGYYAVKVDGTDISGEDSNKFEAYDDSNTASGGFYIINFLAVGTGPRIHPISPEGYKNVDFIIEADVTGIDASDVVYYNVGAEVPTDNLPATVLTKVDPTDPNNPRYKATVNISSLSDGKHKIYFFAKKGDSSDTGNTSFTVDKTAPTVDISSPDLSRSQSGDFTMRGSVVDIPSGVKSIKYIVGKQKPSDPDDITTKPLETSSDWKSLSLSGDTWAIGFTGTDNITQKVKAQALGKMVEGLAPGVELYDIPIFFLVEDKAGETTQKGNIDIIRRIIRVDPNGDIPEVTVLSPEADKVLGGTIRISGTVSVPNPAAGQVGSMWIQITDKTKTGNPNEPDFNQPAVFGGTNWCPSGGKELSSYTAGSPYWSQEINGNKEFNPSGDTPRTIWFRLRGKNTNGVEGQWTSPIKIKIDKTAPTITGMKVATSGNITMPIPSGPLNPENQTYVSNMWIKGDNLYLCANLAHVAGIEMISISGNYIASPISLVGDTQITGYKIHNQQCFVPDGGNYKMQIPLKTTTNPGINNGFTINITIKAKKLDPTASDLTASDSFSFKYDNTAPFAVFGTKIASSGSFKITGQEFTDDALIGKNINNSMSVLASGQSKKITAFNSASGKVTLESAFSEPTTTGYLIYAPIEYLRSESAKVGIFGAAYDVGAGVEKVKVKYKVGNSETAEETLEFPLGIQKDLGNGNIGFVTWNGELDTSALDDGKGILTITPIDAAGNAHSPIQVEVKHKKKSLAISTVQLGTDLNRNGSIETGETRALSIGYGALGVTSGIDSIHYDWHGNSDGGTFRFKNNKSQIKIGTTGGTGARKYTLKCLTNGQDVHGLTALPASGVITLNATDFNKIGQSADLDTSDPKKRKLLLTVWDSAHGLTCGTDTWKAELELDVIVDTKDRIAPTNEIDPFKWVSETENSLYDNSKANGHIEIGGDLPSTFNQANGLMDRDDKVSGKISITGTAHDDQVITEIWAKIDDFMFTGAAGAGSGTDTKLAAYNNSTGNFTVESGNFDTHGWKFAIVSNDFSVENGHTVKWRLDWDSSKITGGVGTDKTITVTVKDTAQTNTVSNSRKVDVVPYITALKRESKYNTNRSTSGAYNIMRKDPNAVSTNPNTGLVIVTGFNLTGTVTATIPGVAVPQPVSKTGDVLTFTVPSNAKSGLVTITANSIDAINNQTNNSKEYNKQNKPNRPETDLWTDDIAIDVWDDDTTANEFEGSTNPAYPSMARGSNGDLYAAFSNYSTSKVYYSKMPASGAATSKEVFYTYDPPEEACISVSSDDKVNVLYSANYHGGSESAWNSNAEKAGGLYCYDEEANWINVGRDYRQVHRFELFFHNKQLQQFKNFRIARGNNNRIHIAYYDTLSYSIKYATVMNNAQGNKYHERPWINLDGGSDSHDTGSYTGGSSLVLPNNNTNFENELHRTDSTAAYCAIALDGSNRPVVVYADVDTGTLRLARANTETPMTPPSPPPPTTAVANWKVQKVLPSDDGNKGLAEDYFAAQFDSEGYLHIVFRNTRGQICYVKSTNKNTGTTVDAYTFEKSVVIAENGSRVELTMDGTTPYIAYLSKTNAYDGIQIAYYDANLVKTWNADGTENEKGAWNIMTVAMQNRAGDARACIAVAPSSVTAWKAAVGYTPGNVYRVVKYIGE